MTLTATNPVDRHHERLANLDREIEASFNSFSLEDMKYIAELEWIIYTSVNLSAIMLNGHSEATYRRINEVYEPK